MTFFEKSFHMFYSTYLNEEFLVHCVFFDHDIYRLLLRRQNSIMKNSNLSQYSKDFTKEEKIRRFRVNREQAAKIIKFRENVYYYAEIDNYLFMKDEEYCFIIYETINSIAKSRHAKIKCVWQFNDSSLKRTLLNKNEEKTNSENSSKSQLKTNAFALNATTTFIIEISSYVTIEYITASLTTSMINMRKLTLSLITSIFDDDFAYDQSTERRLTSSQNEIQKTTQKFDCFAYD